MGATAFIPDEIRKLPKSWLKEANDRREAWPGDPFAAARVYSARELELVIKTIETATPSYSTREYAGLHRVRDGTVRKWIEAGELEAHKNAAGDWEIPRTATRKRKKARA